MKKLLSIIFLVFLSLFTIYNPASTQEIDEELWKKAMEINNKAIVIDAHAHPWMGAPPENLDLGKKTEYSKVDFISMKEGGLDSAFFSLPLPNDINTENPSKKIFDDIVLIRNYVNKYSSLAEIALTPADIRRIHDAGKRAILFGIEYFNPSPLEGHIVLIEDYYKMGVRQIVLIHSKIDPIAHTDSEETGESGLSQFGKKVIREMNRLGMLIDITHAPDNLQLSIIKESKAPVIASHSCVRALHDTPRNIPDEILKEIAKKGGAVMITFYSGHLSSNYEAKFNEANEKYNSEKKKLEEKFKDNKTELSKQLMVLEDKIFPKRVDIEILIDHIEHAVKIAGIDHVGLGSDFGGRRGPIGLETAAGYSLITYHLLKRGYKGEEIKKILGGNLLSVFSQVQKISSDLQ